MLRNDLIDNKDVAIVGNAQSYVGCALSSLIDAHETVIRINRIPDIAEELGSKTTIFCYNNENLTRGIDTSLFYTLLVHTLNIEGYDKSERPSSGIRCVYSIVTHYKPASLTLYGFDFMQSVSATTPNRARNPHDFDAEEELIREYEAKGLLRIHEVDRST